MSQTDLAKALKITRSAVSQWESGETKPSMEKLMGIAGITGKSLAWLTDVIVGLDGSKSAFYGHHANASSIKSVDNRASNAVVAQPVSLSHKIKAYGHAMGGRFGEFVLNGNEIGDVLAPPALQSVRDAYAVYIVGDSMEPRYFAGEVAYIHPTMPVARGDFVVAQIRNDEDGDSAPLAYVKRFVSMTDKVLKLEQFNPPKKLEFPVSKVVSVHKILMAGSDR